MNPHRVRVYQAPSSLWYYQPVDRHGRHVGVCGGGFQHRWEAVAHAAQEFLGIPMSGQ